MAGKLTLIVVDSLQSAKLLLVLAGRCGVQAKVPGSGREVLEMMRARRPDLVLLDLFVPIMSG